MVYLAKQTNVPWHSSQNTSSLRDSKSIQNVHQVCQSLPAEFYKFFEHVRNLKFDETPNYQYLGVQIQHLKHQYIKEDNSFIPGWAFLPEYSSFLEYKQQQNMLLQKLSQSQKGSSSLENAIEESESDYKNNYQVHKFELKNFSKSDYEKLEETDQQSIPWDDLTFKKDSKHPGL